MIIAVDVSGADAGLLRGEGILQDMHNAHAQLIDQAHFRNLTMANNDTKAKNHGSFFRNH